MSERTISLRVCSAADAETLRALGEETWREAFGGYNTPADMADYLAHAFAPGRMEQQLANPASHFALAEVAGQPAGYLKLNWAAAQTELQDETTLEVERIYVLAAYQRCGVGQLLLDWAVDTARQEGALYLWLGVWEQNQKALHFYERNGFVRFGEHTFTVGEDKQLDYLLRKAL